MSYRTILAVVDDQSASTVAARYALALALEGRSRLVLYSAIAKGTDENRLRHIDRHIEQLVNEAGELGVAVTRITETGRLAQLLPRRVETEQVELVCYPVPPGEHYGDPLQQQEMHRLLQTVRTNLAIFRIMQLGKPHPSRILVPLGASTNDREQRTAFLSALAHSYHSQITLFHRADRRSNRAPDDLTAIRNALRQRHLQVLERGSSGNIAHDIAMEAISHHHDLIVLGASERGLLRRLFTGNPAGDVMHHPPCNAVIFRAGPERS